MTNAGKMLEDGYEPGPEDYRITLKVFGDKEERRALAFVGRAQLSPAGDRDLTADELEEGMGKDVTSCVDFKGEFSNPDPDQGVKYRVTRPGWSGTTFC